MPARNELDSMFYPKSVAVVGVSANPIRWGGTSFLERLQKAGFTGNIYPVNPKASEIKGLKAYPSLKSIPEHVDLVIVAVPGPRVPEVLEDCIAAGAKNVHIFSSGFSETREEEGRLLEEKITEIIKRGRLNVVGPNCMGIYVPASRLAPWGTKPEGSGQVAFVSQSGGHGELVIRYTQRLGIYLSKVISFGNARGLQVIDFLEYLADDPETRIITMYLEGIKDGNKVMQLIKKINRIKPVIVWKGGLTETGARAVASHTASSAGEGRVWQAFFTETGAVSVHSLEEIVDMVMLFLYLPPLRSRRTLLLGGGGGNAVAMADICGRDGLQVPPLSEKTIKELATFIPLAGNSIRNPLDVWMVQHEVEMFRRAVNVAAADPNVDFIIADHYSAEDADNEPDYEEKERVVDDFIIDFAKNNPYGKPLVLAMNVFDPLPENVAAAAKVRRKFALAGIPSYASQANATKAISRFIKYYEFLAQSRG